MNKGFVETYFNFEKVDWSTMWTSVYNTLFMTIVSTVLVVILGLLLGLALYSLGRKTTYSSRFVYTIVSIISNIFRSTPFMILMVLLIPFTTLLVGTFLGATAAIPALVLSATPFYARLVEISFREVDSGVLEAAEAMGASYGQIIYKILIPESLPSLISGVTVTTITMIGYTAIAGAIGAGGLGAIAWQEGYQRSNYTITLVATVLILVIVFIIQAIGDYLTKRTDKR
ncbi:MULTISPECIES: methionine ABC transporter permease [Enterococcus]|uniref:ABC transporter permease n=1 Tax=Enterococcus sulfureus ATCC 49903 TaxID=1140003 RepID=S0P230_9ENTE|nr:methionine ABC transporter permease [Enterococcus sulfureus]EOT48717.1 ABC transporter permease [Enterococcus sulfureus ATCC 49903]EOT87609.1 ABC transporter permease [Enterococcus sulfureus ATCC 49903]